LRRAKPERERDAYTPDRFPPAFSFQVYRPRLQQILERNHPGEPPAFAAFDNGESA